MCGCQSRCEEGRVPKQHAKTLSFWVARAFGAQRIRWRVVDARKESSQPFARGSELVRSGGGIFGRANHAMHVGRKGKYVWPQRGAL